MQARPGTNGVQPLSLDDAVKAALDHNLNIEVTRLNPQINDLAYASIASTYNLALTSQVSTASQTTPSTTSIAGGGVGSAVENGQTIFNGGITQNLKWGGGGYVLTLNNNKTTSNSTISTFNPSDNPVATSRFTGGSPSLAPGISTVDLPPVMSTKRSGRISVSFFWRTTISAVAE